MLQPTAIVFYVNDLAMSAQFYQQILGIPPEAHSPSFVQFTLANGMALALKLVDTVEPAVESGKIAGELAFTVESQTTVDKLFNDWQAKQLTITQSPTMLPFGYCFQALDPDGNRLRVVSLTKQ